MVNNNTVFVKDSKGNIVEGDVYLASDGKTIVFVPKYGYRYNETYTIYIDGVKDWGGNIISGFRSSFSTFKPEILKTILDVPYAMAIDKYKDYIVVKGDPATSGLTINSFFKIIDVKDPVRVIDVSNPVLPVAATFYENPSIKGVKAIQNLVYEADELSGLRVIDLNY